MSEWNITIDRTDYLFGRWRWRISEHGHVPDDGSWLGLAYTKKGAMRHAEKEIEKIRRRRVKTGESFSYPYDPEA